MRSYEVLREAADKVGVKSLASALRVSPALIYKWCEETSPNDPDASGTRNPLDRLREIVQITGHVPVVGWLCHEADGFFVHNPEDHSSDIDSDLLKSTQHLVMAFSRLLEDVSQSVADDGAIDPQEADQIRLGWESLKTTAETFVVACERGVYRKRS